MKMSEKILMKNLFQVRALNKLSDSKQTTRKSFDCIRGFYKYMKIAILALLITVYSYKFSVFSVICTI